MGVIVLAGLFIISLYNYLFFHSLAELFSIVIACGLFLIAWNTRRMLDNHYLLFIGIAYLYVGILDLAHTLVYTGMHVFPGLDTNPPTQLWIAARYTESLSLLMAPLFLRRELKAAWIFGCYSGVTLVILASIFPFHLFPDCYIQGVGLTPFKVVSEYLISFILFGALIFLTMRRNAFDTGIFTLVILSIAATIASELFFTFYIQVNDLSNLIGHYLKILSFYLLYKAIIQTGLTRPYNLLFKNLRASEERYRGLVELSPESIFINRNNRIVFVNPAMLQLFGATGAEQILGKSPFDIFHGDYHSIMRERIERLQSGRRVDLIEMKIVRADGTLRDVEAVAAPYLDQEGPAIQAVLRDITERKQAEEKLRQSEEALRDANESLEQKIRKRTADLQNLTEQLEKSRNDLRSLASELLLTEERERKKIATILHDDVCQTLAAAKMRIDLLQGMAFDDESMNHVRDAGEFLVESIRETRAIMNELGNPLLYDMGLSAACQSLAERLMARHPIRIQCDVQDDSHRDLDTDRKVILFQVIQELLNNVVKHSQARRARVSIRIEDGFMRAEVRDDGKGFDPVRLGTPSDMGGYGLFSIKERLAAFNGRLQIESGLGSGATVTVTLPYRQK